MNQRPTTYDDDLVGWLAEPATGAWDDLGYERFPLGEPDPADTVPATIAWSDVGERYDAVVVGSGAGRCLQGHTYVKAGGFVDDVVSDGLGPGPSVATREFNHHNDGIVGGGMLADDFVVSPVQQVLMGPWIRGGGPRPEGVAAREAVRDTYRRAINLMGPIQEMPTRDAGLRLSSKVRDRWGLPVARFFGEQHPEDLRTSAFLAERAREWIEATGAEDVAAFAMPFRILSGGQHQAGTARMSDSPARGAVDTSGKVWGCERVFVADSSLHVTNGGVNPVLSIMANAWRVAAGITVTARS